MKNIYERVRALLYVQRKTPSDNPLPADITRALLQFEQANRGHRHLLDTPELKLLTPLQTLARGHDLPSRLKRRQTVQDSSYALLNFLYTLNDDTIARYPQLQELLEVAGEYERLLHGLNLYVFLGTTTNKLDKGMRMQTCSYAVNGGKLRIEGIFWIARTGYELKKLWTFEAPEVPTLGAIRKLVRAVQTQLTEDVTHYENWPEMQIDKVEKYHFEKVRQELDYLMRGWPAEKRRAAINNWDQLKPRK